MRRILYLTLAILAAFSQSIFSQDDGEMRIRKALEGRFVLTKMDLPAIDAGVFMYFDDANVSIDEAAYKKLLKDNGVAVKKGSRSKITAVRVSTRGIEIDLDGGGSPSRDWVVAGMTLTEPQPAPKSDRELEIERQLQLDQPSGTVALLRNELEYERHRRTMQDERNRQSFDRFATARREHIEANRKNWGSRLIVLVRSRKPTVTMRDMMTSLAKYIEILPREPASE
jgi:hypothetical protein